MFARRVCPVGRRGGQPARHGGDVDDHTLTPLPHARQDRLDHPDLAEDVGLEHGPGVLDAEGLDSSHVRHTRIVDQDVDAAPDLEDVVDRRPAVSSLLAPGPRPAPSPARKQLASPPPPVPPPATATPGAPAPPPAGPPGGPASSPPASSSPGAASAPPPPTLAWRPCTPGAFQCATIAVPLDWSHAASGAKVQLSLIRLPASGAKSQRIGSLFVNPGGPGAS